MVNPMKKVAKAFDNSSSNGGERARSNNMQSKMKVGESTSSIGSLQSHSEKTSSSSSLLTSPKKMPGEPRRTSMGHAAKATGSVMRTAAFAPVMAGKAMVQGGVRVVQGSVNAGTAVVTGIVDGSVKAGQMVVDTGVKTTTNIAKSVESGGKAMVGGSMAVVGQAGCIVDYGGKSLLGAGGAVLGAGGMMVKGIQKATNIKSLVGMRTAEDKKTKWEKGIEVIDQLLTPGSDTYQAMTPQQRKELAGVKKLLITGPAGGDKIAHIPRDLIKMKQSEIQQRPGERRLSSNFILQEFAGLKDIGSLAEGSELDTSESSQPEDEMEESESERRGYATPYSLSRLAPEKRGVSRDDSVASLCSLRRGSGIRIHDDPNSDVVTFVPAEFKKMSREHQMELYTMLSWNSINRWDFNIFRLNQMTKRRPLLFIGWAILGSPYAQSAMAAYLDLDYEPDPDADIGYPFMDDYNIPPQKLCEYLRIIEHDYRAENPYHNAIHAADVLQTLHCLIQASLEEDFLVNCPPIKIFSILLSAVVHDVDHPGKTNAFHTGMRTELAIMYNDTSVLENWHVAHAFARLLNVNITGSEFVHESQVVDEKRKTSGGKEMTKSAKESETNFLCNVSVDQFKQIRNLMIEAVLHTDMTKHFAMVNAAKGLTYQEVSEDNTWKVLMFMLHMADISGQAKPDPLFQYWTDRCMSEFFAQGDEERDLGLPISPNCDRNSVKPAESQVGFIKFVVEPAYEVLAMFVPYVQEYVMNCIQSNLAFWVEYMERGEDRDLEASFRDDSNRMDSLRHLDSSGKDLDGSSSRYSSRRSNGSNGKMGKSDRKVDVDVDDAEEEIKSFRDESVRRGKRSTGVMVDC